jgi:V-type H+-transporting ATPase subunit d
MSLGFTTWNMADGFLDALVRGWRSTFLTDTEYSNLKEGGRNRGSGSSGKAMKEDFEDMRLTLQETDYGNFLSAEPTLDPKLIARRATEKWVKEFKYFRASAMGPAAKFMDYVA